MQEYQTHKTLSPLRLRFAKPNRGSMSASLSSADLPPVGLEFPVEGEVFQFACYGGAESGAEATVYDAVVVG